MYAYLHKNQAEKVRSVPCSSYLYNKNPNFLKKLKNLQSIKAYNMQALQVPFSYGSIYSNPSVIALAASVSVTTRSLEINPIAVPSSSAPQFSPSY